MKVLKCFSVCSASGMSYGVTVNVPKIHTFFPHQPDLPRQLPPGEGGGGVKSNTCCLQDMRDQPTV